MVIKIAEVSKDIDTLPEEAQILLLDLYLFTSSHPTITNYHVNKRRQ
ncbi:MAG: hypothetical protein PT119_23280 [Aphanizomenon gracile PMC627.10]|nr:hypothetical protein [Aphanizomenon gracile PMC627.10]